MPHERAAKRAAPAPARPKEAAASRPTAYAGGVATTIGAACPCGGGCPRCGHGILDDPALEAAARMSAADVVGQGSSFGRSAPGVVRLREAPSLISGDAGTPLAGAEAETLTRRLGVPRDQVRVHTGGMARRLVGAANAAAFAHGHRLYFPSYADVSGPLLAHELAHLRQQATGPGPAVIQRQPQGHPAATDDFEPVLVHTVDRRVLLADGQRIAAALPGITGIVIITDRASFFTATGAALGVHRLRPGDRISNGVYVVDHTGTHLFGARIDRATGQRRYTAKSVTFGMSTEFMRSRGHPLGRTATLSYLDFVAIDAAQETRLVRGTHLLLVSDPPTGHQAARSAEPGPEPSGEGFHPEFRNRAPALRNPEIPTRVYEYPPLPATVEGLDLQPSGGVGAYQMRIDYGAAGGNLLNQASWAAQPTWYRWEVWKVREDADARAEEQRVRTAPMVREGDPGESGRVVDRGEGSSRNWARARQDLAARPGEIRRDMAEALREDRYLDALGNELNERLFDLETAARYGREILNTAADTFGTDRERQIPWRQPGLYIVRCIAVMNPQAQSDAHLRAPSMATRVVRVMPLADLTRQAIESQDLEVARLQAHAALIRTLPADDPSRSYLPDIEARIARIERESRGSPATVVAEQLAEAIRKRDEAVQASIFLRHGLHDPEVNRWNALVSRLTAQQELIGTRTREIAELGSVARRARAAFVSGVTGQMYPLLFQVGEPVLRDGVWVCMLSDVTDPDSRPYRGEVRNVAGREQEQKVRAVWEAVERWVRAAPFGAGNLLVQLPSGGQQGNWFASLGAADRERRLEVTSSRDRFATTQRLEELATLLAILGLLVTAPEIALAAGALGAAVAANRLITRISEDTFRWDSSAIGDVLNIVSAFATGVRLVGALERVERAGGWVIRVARTAERVEQAADVGNLIIINAETVNTFLEIEEAVRQGLSETEARRRRFHAIASAAQGNAMFIAARVRSARVTELTTRPRRPVVEQPVRTEPASPTRPAEPARPEVPEVRTRQPVEAGGVRPEQPHPVGDIIDLPETSVGRPPLKGDPIAADQMYRNAIADTPHREVGLYYNAEMDAFITVQGDQSAVYVEQTAGGRRGPETARQQEWHQLFDEPMRGRWQLLAHSHPVEGPGRVVPEASRLPSGGEGDFGVLVHESVFGDGGARTSRLDLITEHPGDFTAYGYDPRQARPFWVDFTDPGTGTRTRQDFATLAEYHQWYQGRFGADLGPIPDWITQSTAAPPARTPSQPRQPRRIVVRPRPEPSEPATRAPAPEDQGPMQTDRGDLTPAGQRFLVERFPTDVDELAMNRRVRSTADMTLAELNEVFQRRPAWLEALVRAELERSYQGSTTERSFLLSNPNQTLRQVATRIRQAARRAGTGHQVDGAVLSRSVMEFVNEQVTQNPLSQLARLLHQLEATPSGREFLWGDPNPRGRPSARRGVSRAGDRSGILLGVIGDKRPDFVHVDLGPTAGTGGLGMIDATFALGDPRHLFKSAFYQAVLQAMTGLPTSATDYRSALRQRPL